MLDPLCWFVMFQNLLALRPWKTAEMVTFFAHPPKCNLVSSFRANMPVICKRVQNQHLPSRWLLHPLVKNLVAITAHHEELAILIRAPPRLSKPLVMRRHCPGSPYWHRATLSIRAESVETALHNHVVVRVSPSIPLSSHAFPRALFHKCGRAGMVSFAVA